tara:strand:- start:476 stop:589 length:114 start_codon:yes stop_codon:yes gene_type:complete
MKKIIQMFKKWIEKIKNKRKLKKKLKEIKDNDPFIYQ